MSGWLWMLHKFGLRRTFWYWREGRRRGWIRTLEDEFAFAQWLFSVNERPDDLPARERGQ